MKCQNNKRDMMFDINWSNFRWLWTSGNTVVLYSHGRVDKRANCSGFSKPPQLIERPDNRRWREKYIMSNGFFLVFLMPLLLRKWTKFIETVAGPWNKMIEKHTHFDKTYVGILCGQIDNKPDNGLNNGLSPVRRQAIIQTSVCLGINVTSKAMMTEFCMRHIYALLSHNELIPIVKEDTGCNTAMGWVVWQPDKDSVDWSFDKKPLQHTCFHKTRKLAWELLSAYCLQEIAFKYVSSKCRLFCSDFRGLIILTFIYDGLHMTCGWKVSIKTS